MRSNVFPIGAEKVDQYVSQMSIQFFEDRIG